MLGKAHSKALDTRGRGHLYPAANKRFDERVSSNFRSGNLTPFALRVNTNPRAARSADENAPERR